MTSFERHPNLVAGEDDVYSDLRGFPLLENPILNKGSAFPEEERRAFGLDGLLPPRITDIEEQLDRVYGEFSFKPTAMEKHIYLRALQDRNEVLFYRLLGEHLEEMMPLVYTPTVGDACRHFSHIFRRARGLYLSYPDRDRMREILRNRPSLNVDVIVVTDGERILGLGDQGVGGMGIPIGKLSLYTLCGGIHPARTLPIFLDVGTDNEELLRDPHYLGWRHPRIRGDAYFDFIEQFVETVVQELPDVLLQWEDFSRDNATALLERYRDRLCTFNDDIQGTAAVTVGDLFAAMAKTKQQLKDQRVVILGAGSAAVGIATQLKQAIVDTNVVPAQAAGQFWLLNSKGLLHEAMPGLRDFQRPFARPAGELADYAGIDPDRIPLSAVVSRVRPTLLVGVSGQPNTFSEAMVRELAGAIEQPIIFPLSNPTANTEARPIDLIEWTNGRAIVATGSPFSPVSYGDRQFAIPQCNNSFIFPGVGLGTIASRARRVTPAMFMAASKELAKASSEFLGYPILPPLQAIRDVSRRIGLAVGRAAMEEGVAENVSATEFEERLAQNVWRPNYPRLRPL